MSGVRHLIQLKGDFSMLGVDLRHKLYRFVVNVEDESIRWLTRFLELI